MKISVGFIKIHQAIYKISALTLLPLEVLIFITKTKKIIISWATLTNKICILIVWGQGIHIFTHNGEKKRRKSLQLMTGIFGGPPL